MIKVMIAAWLTAFGAGWFLAPQASAQTQSPSGRREAAQCLVRIDGQQIRSEGCPRISFDAMTESVELRVRLDYWRKTPHLVELGQTYTVGVALRQEYREDVVEALWRGIEIRGRVTVISLVEVGEAGDYVLVRIEQ